MSPDTGKWLLTVEVGQPITVEVMAIGLEEGRVRLSVTPADNPELRSLLRSRNGGEILSGTVAAIEWLVFVSLGVGPDHPVFPGVGLNSGTPDIETMRETIDQLRNADASPRRCRRPPSDADE
ncbi:hypothetical protein ACSHXN_44285 (plasmid) [Streptomyces sp. HUAS TT11]|uniref:hypothetical protein n=1 Tax=Streptomyces sp. HUAS TT11 TaxID=3447508 RepID=UPI003F65B40D